MRIVDAGEIPLEFLVKELLHPATLSKILPKNGVACFVLARSTIVNDLFERLVRQAHTIDDTLRKYVEFIIFHGHKKALSHKSEGVEYRYQSPGMSFSSGREGQLPKELSWPLVEFNHGLKSEVAWAPSGPAAIRTARVSEAAVSLLRTSFQVQEPALPCLAFVDAGNLDDPLIIPLSPEEPVRSLYETVLAPLSKRMGPFEDLWEALSEIDRLEEPVCQLKRDISWLQRRRAIAGEDHEDARSKLDSREANEGNLIDRINELEIERERLRSEEREYSQARGFEERLALLSSRDPIRDTISPHLKKYKALLDEAADTSNPVERRRLEKLASKEDTRILSLLGRTRSRSRRRLKEIAKLFETIGLPRSDLKVAIARSRNEILRCDSSLSDKLPILERDDLALTEAVKKVEEQTVALHAQGVSQSLVSEVEFGARKLVAEMMKAGQLGWKGGMSKMVKVLMFTASPPSEARLDLERESRMIDEQLRSAKFRDQITLITAPAARGDDVVRLMRQHKPDVVHFSGHGNSEGVALRDDGSGSKLAKTQALVRLFKGRGVKLVVLNSCLSQSQAEAIAETGAVVIGTRDAVGDEAAQRFSAAFYRELANGCSIAEAARDGRDSVELHGLLDVYVGIGDTDLTLFGF